jgi:hypothetical protein
VNGKAEVARLRQRLDAAFARFDKVGDDLEVRADFARYLCVLVSGFLERALVELATECARQQAAPVVRSYAAKQLARFQNANMERVLQLVGSFSPEWRTQTETFVEGPVKDAVDSLVAVRHQIAHGEQASITFHGIREYRDRVYELVDFLADRFCPLP